MRRITLSVFLLLSCLSTYAQQNHFIYIQTENKQPFYVKFENKLYSSSLSGYLIVPKLTDGTYHFSIGFPKNEWPEQSISCTINKKDAGYLLKNFGDRGWGLFNLQTMDVQMANTKLPDDDGVLRENKTDAFSNVLASVVNDPSIRQREIVREPVKLIDTIAKETVKQADPVEVKTEQPVVPKEVVVAATRSRIVPLGKAETTEGTLLIYIDAGGSKPDTISVLIPPDKKSAQPIKMENKEEAKSAPEELVKTSEPAKEAVRKVEEKITEPAREEVKKETVKVADPVKQGKKPKPAKTMVRKEEKKFIDIELPNPNGNADSASRGLIEVNKVQAVPDTLKGPVLVNSDCRNFATDDDFLKLRKKMAASDTDDGMIAAAKKLFKAKCFTTAQLRNLSVLFLKDAGKFKFLEEAYPFVSDPHNFPGLQNQFTDENFVTRFKAMVTH